MIKKIQFSEDSSLFRNELTTAQDNQTRRNSYSVPTKRPVIKQIFEFYTKQSYTIGVNATFDRQNIESNDFTLAKFFRFCQDFKIQFLSKKVLQEIYIRCATYKCHMNFYEFEKLISILAYYRGINLHQFYDELGLSSWQKNLNKMKIFGKPFHMKDDTERFKKDELHYKFELYHPDIKNKELISDILQQRKVNQQLQKLQQKEKKEKQKLQFELKFLNGIELMEKYPGKQEIIKQISNKKQKQHIQYYKSIHKEKYSKKPSQQTKFIQQPPLVSWKNVENYQIDEKLIESLIEPSDTEDYFLQNYEINSNTKDEKSQLKDSYQEYGKINQKINIRSFSDTKPQKKQVQKESQLSPLNKKYHHKQNAQTSLIDDQNLRNHYTERNPPQTQINVSYTKSPEKFNISMLKRANEIQNQEDQKQKELFEKILLRKNELQHQKPIYNF